MKMDSNIKVSVVVPVYNVEKYLKQCLDSLVNQTLEDIQIICVNDGSTDSSLNILEEYGKDDSRIQIVSQKNKGLSGARNAGMKHIKGQYTFFIDSDDWIELDTLEQLYNESKTLDLDVLIYQVLNYHEDSGEFEETQYGCIEAVSESFDSKVFTYKDVLDVLFKIPHSAFNKLYKTSFLKNIQVEFLESLNYEDVPFFFSVFLKASKVSILRKPLYFYRVREDSIMGSAGESSCDIFKILEETRTIINQTDILETNFQDFLLYLIVNFKKVYSTVNEEFKEKYFNKLKNTYSSFNLDKVENYDGWHYSDKSFHQAITKSNTSKEFDLTCKLLNYKFLANHYKGLYEQSKELYEQSKTQNNNHKSFKNKFKRFLNK